MKNGGQTLCIDKINRREVKMRKKKEHKINQLSINSFQGLSPNPITK